MTAPETPGSFTTLAPKPEPSQGASQNPPPKTRKRHILLWILIFAALAGGAWAVLKPSEGAKLAATARHGGGHEGPVSIVAAAAEKGDSDVILNALGTVTPLATVTVRTQINGQLTEVGFEEGKTVKQGDFLAQIDPRPYENALHQAEGQLTKDQALLKDAETDLARYQKLVAQDSLAKQQLDTQASLVDQYKGAIETDQAAIDAAKLNLTYCHIISPITGLVGLRQVDAGNYVQTSDANGLVTLTQMQPISVLFTLPEDDVPTLLRRMKEDGPVAVDVYDRAQNVKLASGTLAALNNQIDDTTGTLKLRALFANEDGALFPNQFVNVRLLVRTLKDATLVPSAAVQRGVPGIFVYLVNDNKTVSVRTIKIGSDNGQKTVVTDGLAPGDRVAIDGMDKLHDGATITE
jgi:multidrug efflux system membrane fusion protein